jgi:hypothetical protein
MGLDINGNEELVGGFCVSHVQFELSQIAYQ